MAEHFFQLAVGQVHETGYGDQLRITKITESFVFLEYIETKVVIRRKQKRYIKRNEYGYIIMRSWGVKVPDSVSGHLLPVDEESYKKALAPVQPQTPAPVRIPTLARLPTPAPHPILPPAQ